VRLARLAACCLIMLAFAASTTSATASARPADAKMVSAINKVRARHGLRPFSTSRSLERSSERFASRLMRSDTFGHRSRVSASASFHNLGEALALRSGSRPATLATLRNWLSSPGHRGIVLSRRATRVGVGVAGGRFRGGRAVIWVLQVGRP
jgi:uncharacterized protein YkwD